MRVRRSRPTIRDRFRAATLWRAKILAKVVLSRLPVSYTTLRKFGIFRLGYMDSPTYAMAAFDRNTSRFRRPVDERGDDSLGLFDLDPAFGMERPALDGARLLELGPGEMLFSAVLAHAAGAASIVAVDVGDNTSRSLDRYHELDRLISDRWGVDVGVCHARSLDDILERCHASYLTQGLDSLRSLDSASIDIAWSHAVLEHVAEPQLPELLRELRRVMAPDGVASHQVDLCDHLDEALNNLRFAHRVWESKLLARSGFYTNRVGFRRMLELFREADFEVEVTRIEYWDQLPTPRERLAPEFRSRPEEDLLVNGFDVVLRPI